MLNFIFTQLLILKKKKQLHEIRLEHDFFTDYFSADITKNEESLREEMGLLRSKKPITPEDEKRMIEINREVTNLSQVKTRIANSKQIERELLAYIEVLKKI